MRAKSKRPYLIRALNEWILDSDLTPYLMVDVRGEEIRVPSEYVSGGKIVLNISPSAVRDLVLGDDAISFSARFGGRPHSVYVPVSQVLAIYARETSEGMMFEEESPAQEGSGDGSASGSSDGADGNEGTPGGGPDKPGGHLKVVK
jgi:stringent starvation protein B